MIKTFIYSLMLAALISVQGVVAQNNPVTGKVSGTDGQPIPGVSVVVQGTTVGTTTGNDGEFQLNVPVTAQTLSFSFVGMKTQEVSIAGKTVFTIVMEEDAIGLEEVVAIGYGSQKKKDITGAVTSVRSSDFNKGIATSPGQLLQGKVSGVNITSSSGAPGSGQRITIRGQGTIRQGSGPLFVIDGSCWFGRNRFRNQSLELFKS